MQYPQMFYNQQQPAGQQFPLVSQQIYGNNVHYHNTYNIQQHQPYIQPYQPYFQNHAVQSVLPTHGFYQQLLHQHQQQYNQHLYQLQGGFQQPSMKMTTLMNDTQTEITYQNPMLEGGDITINDNQLQCSSSNKKFHEEYKIEELIAQGGNGTVFKGKIEINIFKMISVANNCFSQVSDLLSLLKSTICFV